MEIWIKSFFCFSQQIIQKSGRLWWESDEIKNGFEEVTEKLINYRLTGLEDKMDDVILKGYIQIKCSNPGRLKRKVSLWANILKRTKDSILKEKISIFGNITFWLWG